MQELMLLMVGHAIPVVFLVTFAARVGLPVPASPVLVVAGALAAVAEPALLIYMVAAAVLANVLGDAVWFYAGRIYGYRFMRLLCKISISPDSCVRRSETLIGRWGGLSLVAAKFVPGVSVVAPPMAGALGMSSWRFLVFEVAGALLWVVVFLGLGWLFRDEIQAVLEVIADAGTLATVALVVVLAAMLVVRYLRRRAFLRLTGMPRVTVGELRALMSGEPPPIVIDVRGDAGVQVDPRRIPGALPVSLKELQQRRSELPFDGGDREIILYCSCPNEVSAALAAQALAARGMKRARPLLGGLEAWVDAGHPTTLH
ncbi:VTT domain-containing protein [Variovorax sp. J22P240]|uniref:VTT domain-containing protein n=1 Tax=Variovorax sp. J22P240 TaxID=3053514 RepID=UPI0025759DB7|nr:VTT domain-containing protein [Variovorax sp. J22P240]MDM0001698.1 VTT domain-containing protein [Variovorax sp. J22P240]